jgi:hypothetical protein
MNQIFHAAALVGDEVSQAFPLIQATSPDVDLSGWRSFVKFFTDRDNSGVIALRDPINCVCGVLAYQLDHDLRAGPMLTVHLFTAADLSNSQRTVQALLDAAENRASILGCSGLQIRLSEQQGKLGSRLMALGLSSEAGFFRKKLDARPAAN